MAWDDAPPTAAELTQVGAKPGWDSAPPTESEIALASPSPATSPVTAATTGLINGATLGWAPSLGAIGPTVMNAVSGFTGPLRGHGGSLDEIVDDYIKNRDDLRDDFTKAAAAHPKIAMAANLAGGAGTLGAIGPAAMTSGGLATTGAVTGLGNTDINSAADLPQAAGNAAIGAATTLAGGKAVQAAAPYVGAALAPVLNPIKNAASSAADSVANFLGNTAETSAVRSLNPIKPQFKQLLKDGNVTGPDGLGRALLDTPGAMNLFSSLSSKQAAMAALKDSSGKAIGNTLDTLDSMGFEAPSPSDFSRNVDSMAAPLAKLKTAQPTYNALNDVSSDINTIGNVAEPTNAADLANQRFLNSPNVAGRPSGFAQDTPPGQLPSLQDLTYAPAGQLNTPAPLDVQETPPNTFSQAQDIKNFVNDQVKSTGGWKGPNPSEKNLALRDVYSMISNKLESSVDSAASESGDRDLLNNYLKAKSNYGNASTAGNILDGSTAAEAANNKVGLTSVIVGAGDLAAGNPVTAAAKMGAWQGAKMYGNNFTARGADALSSVVEATPAKFGKFAGILSDASKRGAVSLGATDYLLQQNSQEYRDQRNKVFNPGTGTDEDEDKNPPLTNDEDDGPAPASE